MKKLIECQYCGMLLPPDAFHDLQSCAEYLRAHRDSLLYEIERLQNQAIDYVAVNAELVEKVERLQAERRWIPVSERLPEDCLDVIICEIVMDYECVSAGFYDEAGKQWFSKSGACDYVSHWMPIPPPPESE